ncbi:hypothetical protein Pcinc_001650 [Petrolisthes cinctipes]|uniref:Uncharacterized protein n=1 Tax=Petrolisthes cinctipes TaxID=88211 RepID=A0AAE1GME8_PETCI|nr:hypothetical protein Pcinc_001650 [Petrolisthes cinctipes]
MKDRVGRGWGGGEILVGEVGVEIYYIGDPGRVLRQGIGRSACPTPFTQRHLDQLITCGCPEKLQHLPRPTSSVLRAADVITAPTLHVCNKRFVLLRPRASQRFSST